MENADPRESAFGVVVNLNIITADLSFGVTVSYCWQFTHLQKAEVTFASNERSGNRGRV